MNVSDPQRSRSEHLDPKHRTQSPAARGHCAACQNLFYFGLKVVGRNLLRGHG